ncbi:ribonuclease H-like domain-containing protein [Aspergillus pseudonomiae]|uniref:Ribonuclease H-like domain-containing protein n=1 Tax=Aspergillus pseudonomiae TaxID=1506151 RepID=A0A5N6I8X4_9EURO|nr:ribonuclease H-like domain-containing protein [Aspergillus pseudonomiae]KAB8262477.1 ribonuclease H-like domain-containing protein [Aspergillus pseudonomiae]KAE8402855.1 ribonuclease H-like domain-containing protein [Aspergillus pseudonomiae]
MLGFEHSRMGSNTYPNGRKTNGTFSLTAPSAKGEWDMKDGAGQANESVELSGKKGNCPQQGQSKGQWRKGKGKWQKVPLSEVAKPAAPYRDWSVVPKPAQAKILQDLEALCHSTNPHVARMRHPDTSRGHETSPSRRSVVAIDCEMVQVGRGQNEVVQVCAVDVLSGEILVDKAVVPTKPVTDWCTPWSGMTADRLEDMRRKGKTVNGWEEARAEVLKFVDGDTILVGHALRNDVRALGMKHAKTLDTATVTKRAVSKEMVGSGCKRTWRLKTLCQDFLGISIQQSRNGHDCVEDTLATREVLLWCVRNPDKLKKWAMEQSVVLAVPSSYSSAQEREDSIPFENAKD